LIAVVHEVTTPIHWEAVLITAVPATLATIGTIATAFIAARAAKVGAANKVHLQSIDKAVNGVPDGAPTLREEVSAVNAAVNGAAPGEDSIRENVQTLVDSPTKPT
jgi:hypothetical protein